MKILNRLFGPALVLLLGLGVAEAAVTQLNVTVPGSGTPFNFWSDGTNDIPIISNSISGSVTNPTSTLTLTSTTTAYTGGATPQLIASNATAGSIVVPTFTAVSATGNSVEIPTMRLRATDTSSTAWALTTVQVRLWKTAPTYTNGDHATYLPATGSAGLVGSFSCTFDQFLGDGTTALCTPNQGGFAGPIVISSGTTLAWDAEMTSSNGGTLTASQTLVLTPNIIN